MALGLASWMWPRAYIGRLTQRRFHFTARCHELIWFTPQQHTYVSFRIFFHLLLFVCFFVSNCGKKHISFQKLTAAGAWYMKSVARFLLVFVVLSVIGSAHFLFGQGTDLGTIRGQVTDSSGAVVPNAKVVIL